MENKEVRMILEDVDRNLFGIFNNMQKQDYISAAYMAGMMRIRIEAKIEELAKKEE
jgi:hypothetical protein